MKKIFAILLISLFIFQTVNASAGQGTLKEIADEMNFELSQATSPEDFQDIVTIYSDRIKKTMDNSSVEDRMKMRSELIASLNPKIAKDLSQVMNVIDFEKLSQEEQARLYLTVIQKNYKQGASWEGTVSASVFVIIVLVMLNVWSCGALFYAMFDWYWPINCAGVD